MNDKTASSQAAALHQPVLLREVSDFFTPLEGKRLLDGTLGLGGHAQELLRRSRNAALCGLDRDEEALELAKERLRIFEDRTHFFHLPFSKFTTALDALEWEEIDGMLLDLGVSSMQLDSARRGFSLKADGPLDMRMDPASGGASARQLVNRERFETLKRLITELGEDPQAGRIARIITEERQKAPIETTGRLAELVARAYPPAWRAKARNHPATRTFQALRMAVNDELGELQRFLDAALSRLRVGGRLAVISFHSLEDRIVKHSTRRWAQGCLCPKHLPRCVCGHAPEVRLLTKKAVRPCAEEMRANPRASSAKLRVVEKIAAAS